MSVTGNKYFSSETIETRLSVLKADFFQQTGLYSQALVNSDVDSITALYQSNGFSNVKVTPEVSDSDAKLRTGSRRRSAPLRCST